MINIQASTKNSKKRKWNQNENKSQMEYKENELVDRETKKRILFEIKIR